MFINKDSLVINDISIGKYITSAKYGFYDTWSSDAGFNTLSGKFVGTFKGTYPKITITFGRLKPEDITMLTNTIFRTSIQTIIYDDPDGTRKTIKTHKGDLELNFTGINKSNGFNYSFVGNEALE